MPTNRTLKYNAVDAGQDLRRWLLNTAIESLDGAARCKRRRRLTFSWSFCVLFSVDATAQQRLDGFSPNLHQKTSFRCSLMVLLAPPGKLISRNFWDSKHPFFWSKNLESADSFCAEMRRTSGKTKTSGITTISRPLNSHPHLAKFGWGHLSYRAYLGGS